MVHAMKKKNRRGKRKRKQARKKRKAEKAEREAEKMELLHKLRTRPVQKKNPKGVETRMKETRGWKESVNKGKKDHLNRLKDAPPFSKAQQQQPKTHWLGPSLIKKQKEFRKIFEFPEDEEIVASA